jgi:hypothetical protein
MSNAIYDVFVSYRHHDAAPVLTLVARLQSLGLKVWLDESENQSFDLLQKSIRNGLAKSKSILIWYSKDYNASRYCQWELTAAYIAGTAHGDVGNRLLVLNPEDSKSHIVLPELADQLTPRNCRALDETG